MDLFVMINLYWKS